MPRGVSASSWKQRLNASDATFEGLTRNDDATAQACGEKRPSADHPFLGLTLPQAHQRSGSLRPKCSSRSFMRVA